MSGGYLEVLKNKKSLEVSNPDPDPISTASAVPASGAPGYTAGMMFRKVCVVEFVRIIAAMRIFENPRSESDGESASRIGVKLFVCMPGMSPEITPSVKPISIESISRSSIG